MPETEEERRIRKERERKERESETPEQRAARKAKEAEREAKRTEETPEQRAARKERERKERESETPEQRAARKAKEAEAASKKEETPEERAARKERERKERESETPEQRAARKAKEAEAASKKEETPEERAARKERERKERESETPEQRAARKERERQRDAEKQRDKERREVVHKPLPQTLQQQQQQQAVPVASKTEPVVQGRNPNIPPPTKSAADDYDDDFEDGFEVEQMLQAQKAVEAENAALKKAAATPSASGSAGAAATAAAPAFVGQSRFGADDLQRQKYRAQFEKDLARATALRRLVDLDDVTAVIADIPPMSEYDLYVRNFGGGGRQQAGVMAPPLEDKIDQEVQADRVTVKSKGLQCPEDLGLFPEKVNQNSGGSTDYKGEDGATSGASGEAVKASNKRQQTTVDATLLSNFLARVFPVMRTLLDETQVGGHSKKSSLPISTAYTEFAAKETLGRPVVKIAYSPVAVQYVLSVMGAKPKAASNRPSSSTPIPADRYPGLAVIWNSNDPTLPDKLLIHSSPLTAGCFSPTRSYLVYAASANGAICVWDLRESDSAHSSDDKVSTVTLRCPSFTTEWQSMNHDAPVVALCVAGYNSMLGRREENDQLVSLDRNGNACYWVVNDGDSRGASTGASGGGAARGSEQEHGQLLASCVRIFRASVMNVTRPVGNGADVSTSENAAGGGWSAYAATQQRRITTDLDFCPSDPSRFVVAAGSSILHLSRFSSITAPSSYAPHSQFIGDATSAPSCVAFSSLDSRILLGGYADGTVRVYLKDEGHPQLAVPVSVAPIRQVRSSATVKLISYVLDDNGVFSILDHGIEEREVPVVQCSAGNAETGKCTAFDVPSEDKQISHLMLGFDNGVLQLHTLSTQWLAKDTRSEKWL